MELEPERTRAVEESFKLLLSSLMELRDVVANQVYESSKVKNLESVKSIVPMWDKLESFIKEVEHMYERWHSLFVDESVEEYSPKRARKEELSPIDFYYFPILRILQERGGSLRARVIKEILYNSIKDSLTKKDKEGLPSNPNIPRWWNRAQWAKYRLKLNGYISSHSPTGIWEITRKGEKALAEKKIDIIRVR